MKKERIKDFIIYGVLILMGIGCIYLICLRAEQLDKEAKCEKVNKAILDIMH